MATQEQVSSNERTSSIPPSRPPSGGLGQAPTFDVSPDAVIAGIREFVRNCPQISEEQASLRDQFAMAALTGLLYKRYRVTASTAAWAVTAYEFADAMMEARKLKDGVDAA